MPGSYTTAETLESMAEEIIGQHHPHLGTARILYLFCEKAGKKNGVELLGKVEKLSGWKEYILEKDFRMEVPLDKWNDLSEEQRRALIDHLLERCYGEEEEETGEMKWKVRDPDVQEFSGILRRHGAWHEGLRTFVEVAHGVKIDDIIEEETGIDADELVEVETTE